MLFSKPLKSVDRLNLEISRRIFYYSLGPQNKDHVNTSDKRPIFNQLQSSKLIEIWVVIAFEANRKNTNIVHISNENPFTNL
jgi:hypothetical protein